MAKEKATPVFEEPEFDEREYIRTERERAKSIIVIFLIGAVLGLASGYLEVIGFWYVSVLIIFMFLLFLRFILEALHIEIPKRTGHKILLGGEFVLTWLVFWIIFLNPPLHVAASPQISDLQLNQSGQWSDLGASSGNIYQISNLATNSSLRVYTYYYGHPITSTSVTIAPSGNPQQVTTLSSNFVGNHIYFNLTPQSASTQEIINVYSTSNGVQGHFQFEVKFV